MTGRVWTISNALSMLRVVLLVPVMYYLTIPAPGNNIIAAVLIVIAGFTDLFDGMLARKLNQVTEVGKVIDPLADKICVGVVVLFLAFQGKLPWWFIAFALVRDLVIFIGGLYVQRTRGVILMSNQAGKWAVTFIAFLILVTVLDLPALEPVKTGLLVVSTIMLVVSSVLYAARFQAVLRQSIIA